MLTILRWQLLLPLSIVCIITPQLASAANVVCLEKWGTVVPTAPVDIKEDPAGYVSGDRVLVISDELAKFWPSGHRPDVESCYVGLLAGNIEKGDYDRFKAFLGKHYQHMWAIHLVSRGGDVGEAIKIGRLLRKYLLHAEAPMMMAENDFVALGYPPAYDRPLCKGQGCICASSCALIWFGAIERGGAVGLHRPKISDPQFGALPPDQASKRYKDVLQEITRYLEEVETPRSLIEAMIATASSDIRWIEAPPNGSGVLNRPPSHTEWINANCDPLSAEDYAALSKLSQRQYQEQRNRQINAVTAADEALRQKQKKRTICRSVLEFSQRDRMSPP